MIDYVLASIIIYLEIGLPFMLYKLKDINSSFQQIYFNWFCWPVVVSRYIKRLWRK